jgi:anti-sigma factor RsiW
MTSEEDTQLLLHAAVDGELDPASALAFERRLAAEPALAADRDRIVALRRALRESLPAEAAPERLRGAILAAVRAKSGAARRTPPAWRTTAAAAVLAATIGSGATWLALQPGAGDRSLDAVLAGHMRSLIAPQPIDVASSDRHAVKPWFNGRVPFAPKVVDLTEDGFPLVGGRVDVVGGEPAATLVYRHRQHLISLTALPAERAVAAASERARDGFSVLRWSADGMAYWAVSDLGRPDLEAFAKLFRERAAAG